MNAGLALRAAAIGLALASALPCFAAASGPESGAAPGLALTASDGGVAITRFGTVPAIYLGPGESFHPSLDPARTALTWDGYLAIESADRYSFRATVEGDFSLELESDSPLSLHAVDSSMTAGDVALEPGRVRLRARLAASGEGRARRLRLEWRSMRFDWESLPLAALRHDPDPNAAVERARIERGRTLVDEGGCVNCHSHEGAPALASLLAPRGAPDLTSVGSHAREEWISAWLEHPGSVRKGTPMPRLFPDTEAGAAERAAVARYLGGLGREVREGPLPRVSSGSAGALDDPEAGERLFYATGCVACHDPFDKKFDRTRPAVPLDGSGSRGTAAGFSRYLLDPLKHDPSGRMPDLGLTVEEARSIAAYLMTSRDESLESKVAAADAKEGARLVRERSCVACHSLEGTLPPSSPPGRPLATLDTAGERACLSPSAPDGVSPRYDFDAADLDAIRAFLASAEARAPAAAPAPIETARILTERLRCDACHAQGGVESELSAILAASGGEAPREAMQPPSLTGVGAKLRGDWLHRVLQGRRESDGGRSQDGRARPWLSLRMPRFGDENAAALVPGLLARDGFAPSDDDPHAPPRTERVMTGRDLLSPARLSCTSCHDMAGVPGSGSRGPEVLRFTERLRRSWFERWMLAPQRIKPATEMPSYFAGGRSLVTEIDAGDAHAQIGAMWDYLCLGMRAPLPDGLTAPSGISLVAKERPLVVRTPLGDRARIVAIGFPSGVSVGVDAGETPGLRLLWDGGFLRANGTQWTGQHGPYPEIEGRVLAALGDAFPWRIGSGGKPRFRGYRVAATGEPTFLYDLALEQSVVRVEETIGAAAAGPASGVLREALIENASGARDVEALLLSDAAALAVLDAKGAPLGPGSRVPVGKSGFVEVLLPGGKRAFVGVRSAPPSAAFTVGASPVSVSLVFDAARERETRVATWTLFAGDADVAATRVALRIFR